MFRLLNHAGRTCLEHDGARYDLARLSGDDALASPGVAIARHRELHDLQAALVDPARRPAADGPVEFESLGAPSPAPQKVFAIGVNYRAHAAESKVGALPPAPLTFTKFPNCLCGPTADVALSGDNVDWEVEVVVVIGDECRNVAAADAWSHVAGLTLGQDVSDRSVQYIGALPQFCLGKSFDTFGPTGPALVSVDSFADPDDVELWCDVSGERMQHARTSDLIFSIPTLVEYLSSICTLAPGDLIFTGTPDGVGAARGRMLRVGDEIVSGATTIGGLHNRCVAGSGPAF
jgi:2-keto-4-pentenoate hydratase/2-oxohepta-3-ene-1,7-dioic acid hydratase in catechol pathway